MKIVCLTPTYGMPKRILDNIFACFRAQEHANKFLFIYDDFGNVPQQAGSDYAALSTSYRAPSLPGKYNIMLELLKDVCPDWEAIAMMDSDDVYLPLHLSLADACLQHRQWAHPEQIVSAYYNPPRLENAAGRFHGALVIRRDLVEYLNGWADSLRATFDQEFLAACGQEGGAPGRPVKPTYVYRWQSTGTFHCSGIMGQADWYAKTQPTVQEAIGLLEPIADDETLRLMSAWG